MYKNWNDNKVQIAFKKFKIKNLLWKIILEMKDTLKIKLLWTIDIILISTNIIIYIYYKE